MFFLDKDGFLVGLFVMCGVYSQYILVVLSFDGPLGGGDVDTYCKPLFLFLSRIENWIISPLLFLNQGAKAIGNLGNNDNKPPGQRGPPNPAAMGGAQARAVMEKFRRSPGLGKVVYILLINKATSRIFLFIINFVMMCMSLAMISLGAGLLMSNLSAFFNAAYIILIVIAGFFLFFISFIGFGAGKTGKFKYLIPYTLMLSAVLVCEVTAFSLL